MTTFFTQANYDIAYAVALDKVNTKLFMLLDYYKSPHYGWIVAKIDDLSGYFDFSRALWRGDTIQRVSYYSY
jgi:hypothetical protein